MSLAIVLDQKINEIPCDGGVIWQFLVHYSPKFLDNVFLFVGLTTLGTFIEF